MFMSVIHSMCFNVVVYYSQVTSMPHARVVYM